MGILKYFAKKGFKQSEKEIINFLNIFRAIPDDEIPHLMSRVALIHYDMSQYTPEFSKLISSDVGANQGAITSFISEMNGIINDLHKKGLAEQVAAAKFWNVTFRCMSNNRFRHYGQNIWGLASVAERLDSIKEELDTLLENAEMDGNKKLEERVRCAMGLADFVPPQFRDG